MVFEDGSSVFRHIQAKHPQYIFFCDYPVCYRTFITRSGSKHKKQVHPKELDKPESEDFTVGYVLCGLEFSSEEVCDEHECPACKKAKATDIKRNQRLNLKLEMLQTEIKGQHVVQKGESKLLFCNDKFQFGLKTPVAFAYIRQY